LVTQKQYERVQSYIRLGVEEGAELLVGGEGHPQGLEQAIRQATVFVNVTNDMRIAREEIFGPVLSILTYRTEENHRHRQRQPSTACTGYVSGGRPGARQRVASQIVAGRVFINGLYDEPRARSAASSNTVSARVRALRPRSYLNRKPSLVYDVPVP